MLIAGLSWGGLGLVCAALRCDLLAQEEARGNEGGCCCCIRAVTSALPRWCVKELAVSSIGTGRWHLRHFDCELCDTSPRISSPHTAEQLHGLLMHCAGEGDHHMRMSQARWLGLGERGPDPELSMRPVHTWAMRQQHAGCAADLRLLDWDGLPAPVVPCSGALTMKFGCTPLPRLLVRPHSPHPIHPRCQSPPDTARSTTKVFLQDRSPQSSKAMTTCLFFFSSGAGQRNFVRWSTRTTVNQHHRPLALKPNSALRDLSMRHIIQTGRLCVQASTGNVHTVNDTEQR